MTPGVCLQSWKNGIFLVCFFDNFGILIFLGGFNPSEAILVYNFKLPRYVYTEILRPYWTLWDWPKIQGGPGKRRKIPLFRLLYFGPFPYPLAEVTYQFFKGSKYCPWNLLQKMIWHKKIRSRSKLQGVC